MNVFPSGDFYFGYGSATRLRLSHGGGSGASKGEMDTRVRTSNSKAIAFHCEKRLSGGSRNDEESLVLIGLYFFKKG
jgi:hypothetical protein